MKRMMVIGGMFLSMLGGGVAAADHYNGPYDGDQEYGREMARPRWTVLGELRTNGWRGNDVLEVSGTPGRVDKLMLVAKDGPVFVRGLTITFRNGERQYLDVNGRFDPGVRSAGIDLPGNGRMIQSIELETRGRGHGRWGWGHNGYGYGGFGGGSRIEVWGQVIPFRRPWIGGGGGYNGGGNGGWESLGTTTLSGYRDRDTLNVGLEEGRFRQLMIVIRDGQGYVSGLAVTLGNGQVMTLPVRVSSDGRGQVVDLPGDLRGVRAVTVLGGGNARVEILGS